MSVTLQAPPGSSQPPAGPRTAGPHRSFWILTAMMIFAAGPVTQALAAPAGPGSDIVLAGSGLLLAASAFLLVRVSRFLSRGRLTGGANSSPDVNPGASIE